MKRIICNIFLLLMTFTAYATGQDGHEKKLPSKTLSTVFKEYANGKQIAASWIMGSIRVAKGKIIYYQHDGYERNYEEEQLISLNHGKVTKKNVFHNYVIDGFAFDDYSSMKDEDFAQKFPLHVERHPELANAKSILFTVKRARVDATGHLVDCEMRAIVNLNNKTEEHKGIAYEMAKCMKAYYPWRVLYINGEYRASGIEGWNFPYRLNGKERKPQH